MSASKKKKGFRRLWPVFLVFLAALAAFQLVRPDLRQGDVVPVNDGAGTIYIVPDPALPASTLESGDFARQGDAVLYTGSRYTASQGVDVSEWQREIRWQEVADGGIDFAVIRCGYRRYASGSLEQDSFFEENYSAAGAAGLRRGVYFFSQAVSPEEAREEAAFVLQMFLRLGNRHHRRRPRQRPGRRDRHRLCRRLLPGYRAGRLHRRRLLQPPNGLSHLRPLPSQGSYILAGGTGQVPHLLLPYSPVAV